MEGYKEVINRIQSIEKRMDKIEDDVAQQSKTDIRMESEFKAIRHDFNSLKEEVLATLKDHTDRTWKLIEKSWKMIMVLISVIVVIAGFKMGPEIIKALLN